VSWPWGPNLAEACRATSEDCLGTVGEVELGEDARHMVANKFRVDAWLPGGGLVVVFFGGHV
jgi:hypothetical protein